MSNTGRPANLPWPVSTGSRRFVVRPTRLSADPYLAWGIAAPNGNSIFLPAARDRVQEILEVHREGKDDCRAALVGDHVEGREIAKLHRFGFLAEDFGGFEQLLRGLLLPFRARQSVVSGKRV